MKTNRLFAVLFSSFAIASYVTGCSDDATVNPANTAGTAGQSPGGSGGSAGNSAGSGQGATSGSGGSSAGQAGAAGQAGTAGQAGDGGSAGTGGSTPVTSWESCQASEQAFVRRAYLAVLGKRPSSQAEVNMYVDIIRAVDQLDGVNTDQVVYDVNAPLRHSRRVAVEAMMKQEQYLFRWIDFYRDALRVQRSDEMSNSQCYGTTVRSDGKAVAEFVRDQPPTSANVGGAFSMRDVILSSLKLDDLSPMYVANLFSMLLLTYPGANAAPDKLELARRADFGAWFDGVYTHRDGVCMKCHNSEASVTYSDDPALNRHFPLPGKFEKALFGDSFGPDDKDGHDSVTRMHGMLRYQDFVPFFGEFQGQRPWGWDYSCGAFREKGTIPPDIAGVDTVFGNLKGDQVTAWELSESLQAGFTKLRADGLNMAPDGEIADPDEAFAYLVAANIAEKVWKEVMGHGLTIANYFPRTQAGRDQLLALTETLVANHFSNRELLLKIMESPYFNLDSPDSECWPSQYPAPAMFDPWTKAEEDTTRRGNGPSDSTAPISSRTLMRMTYNTMGWGYPQGMAFPVRESDEGNFQNEIGVFLKNAEPGFRGFDFQARLGWESRMGACVNPDPSQPDFINQLLDLGAQTNNAKVQDIVAALKDRLVGESDISADEKTVLEAIVGASLDAPATNLTEEGVRRVCGVLMASPQYLLTGIAPADQSTVPLLTPDDVSYTTLCTQVTAVGLSEGLVLSCGTDSLVVTKP